MSWVYSMKIKVKDFDLKSSLMSGACFRIIEESDGSFTNIIKDRIVNIKQEGNTLIIKANNYDNLKEIILEYFDLNRDYKKINLELSKDEIMKEIVKSCNNYRILNQDSFEMCISYIISQNNNVKRISKSIEKLCSKYGKKVFFENKEYYLFPIYDELKNVSTLEFKELGVGFRDKYIRDFLDKYESLRDINILDTNDALKELMTVKGIGMKVASCILLFGYKRLDVFPIDNWVKQFISEHYGIKNDQKTIEKFTREKFKEYSGLAIQYMYHYESNS